MYIIKKDYFIQFLHLKDPKLCSKVDRSIVLNTDPKDESNLLVYLMVGENYLSDDERKRFSDILTEFDNLHLHQITDFIQDAVKKGRL